MMSLVARVTCSGVVFCLLIAGSVLEQSDQDVLDEKRRKRTEVRRLHRLIKTNYESQQYDVALARIDSLLTNDPKNADAFYYKGRIHATIGDTTAAETTLTGGAEAAPRSARIKTYLGRLYFLQDRPAEAIEVLDKVLAIKPKESPALYLKGQSLLLVGDTAAGLEALEAALQIQLAKGHR